MAASNYLQIDTSKPVGSRIVLIHDQLVGLVSAVDALYEELLQINADGNLASLTGATSPDNASALLNLIGGMHNDLHNVGNAFLQAESRIGRLA